MSRVFQRFYVFLNFVTFTFWAFLLLGLFERFYTYAKYIRHENL